MKTFICVAFSTMHSFNNFSAYNGYFNNGDIWVFCLFIYLLLMLILGDRGVSGYNSWLTRFGVWILDLTCVWSSHVLPVSRWCPPVVLSHADVYIAVPGIAPPHTICMCPLMDWPVYNPAYSALCCLCYGPGPTTVTRMTSQKINGWCLQSHEIFWAGSSGLPQLSFTPIHPAPVGRIEEKIDSMLCHMWNKGSSWNIKHQSI